MTAQLIVIRGGNGGQGKGMAQWVKVLACQASLRMWVQTPRTNIKAGYTAQGCHSHAPIWSREDETGVFLEAHGLVSLLFLHGKKQESYLR